LLGDFRLIRVLGGLQLRRRFRDRLLLLLVDLRLTLRRFGIALGFLTRELLLLLSVFLGLAAIDFGLLRGLLIVRRLGCGLGSGLGLLLLQLLFLRANHRFLVLLAERRRCSQRTGLDRSLLVGYARGGIRWKRLSLCADRAGPSGLRERRRRRLDRLLRRQRRHIRLNQPRKRLRHAAGVSRQNLRCDHDDQLGLVLLIRHALEQ